MTRFRSRLKVGVAIRLAFEHLVECASDLPHQNRRRSSTTCTGALRRPSAIHGQKLK